MKALEILILSDLHCQHKSKDETINTRLFSNMMKVPVLQNPMEALKKIITEEDIQADLVICPGDISNRINEQGLITGWSYLDEIKRFINAEYLLGTVGNHDVDSRLLLSDDPFRGIKNFTSEFPVNIKALREKFWSNNYFILETEQYIILVFNSTFSHINVASAGQSKINPETLEEIDEELTSISGNKVKVAMCHHHPVKHSNLSYRDSDSIDKGDDFIRLLQKHKFDIVVHGHKHDPRLDYFNELPVLCAGSFSSIENVGDLGADNVFHHIQIFPEMGGIVNSYVYGPTKGWHQKNDAYFPCVTGFGYKGEINALASKINSWLGEEELKKSESLYESVPEIKFLTPKQQIDLKTVLSINFSIECFPDLPNKPKVISKQVK